VESWLANVNRVGDAAYNQGTGTSSKMRLMMLSLVISSASAS
jgi:hypothetical protein